MVVSMIGLHSVLRQRDLPLEAISEQQTLALYGRPLVPDPGIFRDLNPEIAFKICIFPFGSPIFFASGEDLPVGKAKDTIA